MDAVHITILVIAGIFTALTTIWSSVLIYGHIRHYTKPEHQKYIIRILFMPMIYAVDSWISLYYKHESWAIFIDIARDCYEAYVIYSFFKLLVCYLGGKEAVCNLAGSKPSFDFLPFYLAHDGHKFYHRCLQGIIQYVLLRPTLAVIAAILHIFGAYGDGIYSWSKGYIYMMILINISVTIALYCLGMFYQRFELELRPHNPILKFTVIKGVIFFTFWQSVAIVILAWVGVIPNTDSYSKTTISFFLNDTLICIEMFVAAIAHSYAFPYQQYQTSTTHAQNLMGVGVGKKSEISKKSKDAEPSAFVVLGHVSNQGDVVRDAVASVVGPEGSFVKYHQFKEEDENYGDKRAQQFSIVKRDTAKQNLITEDGAEDEGKVGIEVGATTNDYVIKDDDAGADKGDYKFGKRKQKPGKASMLATEFSHSPPLPPTARLPLGDAILMTKHDEHDDVHYEIEL